MKNIYIISQDRTFIINSSTVSCYRIMKRGRYNKMFEVRADDKILGIYDSEQDALIILNDIYQALRDCIDGETKYMRPRNWDMFPIMRKKQNKEFEWEVIATEYYVK